MVTHKFCCFSSSLVSTKKHKQTKTKQLNKFIVALEMNCNYANDRGFSLERNCVLRRWESETLK